MPAKIKRGYKKSYKRTAYRRFKRIPPTVRSSFKTSVKAGYFKLKVAPSILAPSAAVVSAHWTVRTPVNALELSNVNALYDFYRVCAFKIKFIPAAPNEIASSNYYRPVYLVFDNDADSSAGANITSVNQALQYDVCKIKDCSRPWKYYIKVPKINQGFQTGGVNQCVIDRKGNIDIAKPCYTGDVSLYGDSFTSAISLGTVIITYYCKYTIRR